MSKQLHALRSALMPGPENNAAIVPTPIGLLRAGLFVSCREALL